jgi:hypothetical protein
MVRLDQAGMFSSSPVPCGISLTNEISPSKKPCTPAREGAQQARRTWVEALPRMDVEERARIIECVGERRIELRNRRIGIAHCAKAATEKAKHDEEWRQPADKHQKAAATAHPEKPAVAAPQKAPETAPRQRRHRKTPQRPNRKGNS